MMPLKRKVFICVYRHIDPPKKKRDLLIAAGLKIPFLREFFDRYFSKDNYYDWGDDPSFFAASKYYGDERFATWGVCRPEVRRQLKPGDVVIYICGRQTSRRWDYYYVGFGTVRLNLKDRMEIWNDDRYNVERNFYNLIIDQLGNQSEPFGDKHERHDRRIEAGYIFFEQDETLTNFNFLNPLHIAHSNIDDDPIEEWYSTNNLVGKLEDLLLKKYNPKGRQLRSTNYQRSHPHIRLQQMTEQQLNFFLDELFELSERIKIKMI